MNASHKIPLLTDASFEEFSNKTNHTVLAAVTTDSNSQENDLLCLVEEIAFECQGRLTVTHLRANEQPLLAKRLGVVATPALIVYQSGQIRFQFVGQLSRHELTDILAHL